MGRSFTRDLFRYSPLIPGGGRASRITTLTSLSLGRILAVTTTLLLVATVSFFAGRLSLTDFDKNVIQREFAQFQDSHKLPHSDAADHSDYNFRDI